jgi:PAS domain S-box-containing protein
MKLLVLLKTSVDLERSSILIMENKIPFRWPYTQHLFALIVSTIFAIAVSFYCLNTGRYIVFQNLFYFPIIIACVYYLRNGFLFSVLLTLFYLLLVLAYTSNSMIIRDAFIRVAIFIMVAGIISAISLKKDIAERALGRDITERKRVEELLRQQKEEQQVVFNAIPAMIFYKDTGNKFIRVNRALAEVSGMTVEQIEGNTCFNLFPDMANNYWCDDKEVMTTGVPKRDIIEPMTTPNGVVWVKSDKIPYRDEKGNITGIIGFGIDITELKHAEEEKGKLIQELQESISKINKLSGLLPICASCKKIRNDEGYWEQIESYIRDHSEADFSHSICPECAQKLYPEHYKKK